MFGAPDPEIEPAPAVARPVTAPTLAAVGAGGSLGGLARYLLATAAPPGHGLPWATLAVNVVGAFVVGVLATRIAAGRLDQRVRPFAVTGVCGGLTTFSTVMTEVHLLARAGRSGLAGAYLGLTLAAGLAAAALGARLAGDR
jgi:CrcB protein